MHPESDRVICIGGATVDRKYRANESVHLRTSNPVVSKRSFGGVARNVAENIVRLGAKASLISILGQDENGAAIRENLKAAGVDTQYVTLSSDHATAEYVAVLEPNGDLALGLADMAIFDALTPALLQQCWPEMSASWIFADCNLPSSTLHELVGSARRDSSMLAVDAVSMLKVARLPRDLNGVGLLFLNLDEAQALLGRSATVPEDMAAALLKRGAARVVLTLGEAGLIAMDAFGHTRVGASPAQVVDATGAGDALIAGTLVAMMNGHSLANAAQMGTVAAALTLECPDSVRPDLSLALLESVMARNANQRLEGETL
ncbi:carbohydrate kinase family protein [Microvirga guangxiensis]|uniref:Pseudouridine kinase n=1 Tax=Microvirga guangxiensis TaxID=549386 RepID=A0A1G5K3I1_9HYPH|nr:carbohydrate kinase family protein [Microvirga guangxiensis]SCY94771.1 pseudouridine kinase [Microvirga guangxiensis]